MPALDQVALLIEARLFSAVCLVCHDVSHAGTDGILPAVMIRNAVLECSASPKFLGLPNREARRSFR
jgi:hypothetical protein